MAYVEFTTARVFKNPALNLACNKIYTALMEFGRLKEQELALTGTVAKIIQGEPLEEVKVIPFVMKDDAAFNHLKENLGNILNNKQVIIYKSSIHFKIQESFLEIHLDISYKTFNTVQGILCQPIADIPSKYN